MVNARSLLQGAPKYKDFFKLLADAGANAERAAALLVELLAQWPDDSPRLRYELKEAEQEGDRITHTVLNHLNTAAATPFDASDVHLLISELDDVVDYAEEVADFMGLYRVEAPTDQAIELSRVLHAAALEIAQALDKLDDLTDLKAHVVAIDRLEDDGDCVQRAALATLFEGGIDPMVVIRWKDLYDGLESAIDACGHVGNALEGLLLKAR